MVMCNASIYLFSNVGLKNPKGIDVMFGDMFWISMNTVYGMDKFGRGINVTLVEQSGNIDAITVNHPLKYPMGEFMRARIYDVIRH